MAKVKKENLMLLMAEYSYKRNFRIKEELQKVGITDVFIKEVKDLKFVMVKYDNEIFVRIRGSANKRNWLRNLSCWKVNTKYGKFHAGFWDGCNLIYDELIKILPDPKYSDIKINISGHSLGAVLSFGIGILAEDNGYNITKVRSFAKPSISGEVLYHWKFDYEKYFNNLDIIYRMPPSWLGYSNPLVDITYIDRNGKLSKNPTKEFIEKDRSITLSENRDAKELFKDHEMFYYRTDLWDYR